MWQQTRPSLLEIMAWCLFSAKPLSEPMLVYCQLIPSEQISVKSESKYEDFDSGKYTAKWRPFCLGLNLFSYRIVWGHISAWRRQPGLRCQWASFQSRCRWRGAAFSWWYAPHPSPCPRSRHSCRRCRAPDTCRGYHRNTETQTMMTS